MAIVADSVPCVGKPALDIVRVADEYELILLPRLAERLTKDAYGIKSMLSEAGYYSEVSSRNFKINAPLRQKIIWGFRDLMESNEYGGYFYVKSMTDIKRFLEYDKKTSGNPTIYVSNLRPQMKTGGVITSYFPHNFPGTLWMSTTSLVHEMKRNEIKEQLDLFVRILEKK